MQKLRPDSLSSGWAGLGLSLARVTQVFWEEMRCSIQVLTGENNLPKYDGVEIIMPSIGARQFLGGVPMVGDICVCAWFAADSNSSTSKKSPAIVGWFPGASYIGHEWIPTQDFSTEEGLLNTPKERRESAAVVGRRRHKLRHYNPGNIGASSAQGSDLVLDESVLLSNRRLNEIQIRDQDQAIVTRSLQQFHNMAGARVYGGMVQRDARSLPNETLTDITEWNQDNLYDEEGNILLEDFNGVLNEYTPHPVFQINGDDGKNTFEKAGGRIAKSLNPYIFLYESKLINDDAIGLTQKGEVYGGKSILRVNTRGEPLGESDAEALVEYRIEVSHTSDGTLPVTEQTDGFDADRLLNLKNLPFVEFVLGTPVGNDPISDKGIDTYGLPLTLLFSEESASLDRVTSETLIQDQLATLISIRPLTPNQDKTVSGFTKSGGYRAFISDPNTDAVKARVQGGVDVTSGSALSLSGSGLSLNATEGGIGDPSLRINSAGAISIESKGSYSPNISQSGQEGYSPELDSVGIHLRSKNTIKFESDKAVQLSAPRMILGDMSGLDLQSQSAMNLSSADQITISSKNRKDTVLGKYELVVTGPSDFNPLSGVPCDVTIAASPATGFPGGPVDKYTCAYGDRISNYLTVSNLITNVTSGNILTTVVAGNIVNTASTSVISQGPAGVTINAGAGVVSINAAAGPISIVSSASVGIRSLGATTLSGSTVVLGAPSPVSGFILCALDRDPTTGRTFLETGLVLPRGQMLAPTIV